MPRSVNFTPEIDARLYEELVSVAKENGQSQRFVLERALEALPAPCRPLAAVG
jgi:hypothetical protein